MTIKLLNELLTHYCGDWGARIDFLVPAKAMQINPLPYQESYNHIKLFQRTSIDLLKYSLNNPRTHSILCLFLSDLAPHFGTQFHKENIDLLNFTPHFFRADCSNDGRVYEIQAPGSLWAEHDLISLFFSKILKHEIKQPLLSQKFCDELSNIFPKQDIIIQHFVDSASRPQTVRAFINLCRQHSSQIRFVGHDTGIKARDANFIRTHMFKALLSELFYESRMVKLRRNEIVYDYPPCAIFDTKFPLCLPFMPETQSAFSDRIRNIFPFTSLIQRSGLFLKDGLSMEIDEFISLPRSERRYFIKYAGSNTDYNWGSMAVYYAATQSKSNLERLFKKILDDERRGSPWIIQEAVLSKGSAEFLVNDEVYLGDGYEKICAFYGPSGLMGLMPMMRPNTKVHGAPDTVLNIGLYEQ